MNTESQKNNGQAWKHVVLGGVSGILMGAGGSAMAATLAADDIDSDTQDDSHTGGGVAEAKVDDDMTFGEAFASAREEVGPGGVFEWRGNLYNTFTAEEWESMTEDEKEEFADKVNGIDEDQEQDVETLEQLDESSEDLAAQNVEIEVEEDVEIVEGEPEIEVYSVEEVVTDAGEVVTLADADVDGHSATIIDTNNDGIVDVMTVDENDNMVCDPEEMSDIQDMGLTVEDMSLLASNQMEDVTDEMYADMPDYMNDADTTSYA